LRRNGNEVAEFVRANSHGNADIVLSLSRPVEFDELPCSTIAGNECTIAWVGNTPQPCAAGAMSE
jgi:hypothetical protein